jgi:hypothetical protein
MRLNIKSKITTTTSYSFLSKNPLSEYLEKDEEIKHREVIRNVTVFTYTSRYNTEKVYDLDYYVGDFPCKYDVFEPEMKFLTTKGRVIYGKINATGHSSTYIANLFEEVLEPFLFFFKVKTLKPIGSEIVKIEIKEELI